MRRKCRELSPNATLQSTLRKAGSSVLFLLKSNRRTSVDSDIAPAHRRAAARVCDVIDLYGTNDWAACCTAVHNPSIASGFAKTRGIRAS